MSITHWHAFRAAFSDRLGQGLEFTHAHKTKIVTNTDFVSTNF